MIPCGNHWPNCRPCCDPIQRLKSLLSIDSKLFCVGDQNEGVARFFFERDTYRTFCGLLFGIGFDFLRPLFRNQQQPFAGDLRFLFQLICC